MQSLLTLRPMDLLTPSNQMGVQTMRKPRTMFGMATVVQEDVATGDTTEVGSEVTIAALADLFTVMIDSGEADAILGDLQTAITARVASVKGAVAKPKVATKKAAAKSPKQAVGTHRLIAGAGLKGAVGVIVSVDGEKTTFRLTEPIGERKIGATLRVPSKIVCLIVEPPY